MVSESLADGASTRSKRLTIVVSPGLGSPSLKGRGSVREVAPSTSQYVALPGVASNRLMVVLRRYLTTTCTFIIGCTVQVR